MDELRRRVGSLVTSHSPLAIAFRYSASPMLDLGYVREHMDVIEKMARDRGVSLDLAAFRELDTERRQIITTIERLKAERNRGQRGNSAAEQDRSWRRQSQRALMEGAKDPGAGPEITLAAAMEQRDTLLAKMKTVSDEIKRGDERITELDERLKQFLLTIPNIPHASVPVGQGAADNVEVRRWGTPPKFDFAPSRTGKLARAPGFSISRRRSKLRARGSLFIKGWARGSNARSRISFSMCTRASTASRKCCRRFW